MRFLILTAAVALAFSSTRASAQPIALDRLKASVNSALILSSDIRNFRRTEKLRGQLDPLYGGTQLAAAGEKATDSQIVEFLIDERLIAQQYPVSDSEAEQEINSIQASNKIDRASLKTALTQQGFSFEDYFELIRASASKRNLIDRDIRTKVSISDADVKNYYYNKLSTPAAAIRAYRIQIIFVSSKNYKTPSGAKETAERALQAIRGGEAFEEVAKRFSDDASASSGGDLGTLTEEQISPAIREQLKTLQIGQVSPLFGNPSQGFYILKLVDVQSSESGRLEKMKEEIRNHLLAAEYQHQIRLWLDRQRQSAFIHRVGETSIPGAAVHSP